jgi:hypothetical protein
MQRFKSSTQAQRFLSAHGMIYGHFRQRRHLMAADAYRRARARAFRIWRQETCADMAACAAAQADERATDALVAAGAHLMLKVRTAAMNGTLERDHAAAERSARRPFRRAREHPQVPDGLATIQLRQKARQSLRNHTRPS